MKRSYFYLAIILWLFALNVSAGDQCKSIGSPNEVLKCILSSHPEIKIQEAQLRQDEKEIDVASQRPNPDLDLEGVDNKTGGVSSEVAVVHTFELGGKRDSRIKVAKADIGFSRSELLKTHERVTVQSVLTLYRIRQIDTELGVVEENLRTFRKIRERYKRIGKLNPEQQISVSVFKLSEEDNKLKKSTLLSERENLLSKFRMIIGDDFSLSKELLPNLKKDWPSISVDELKGADFQKAQSEVEIAKAESELANSQGWPDLAVGPKVEIDTGQSSETRIGIALSMPLPFYNTNNGGRARALMRLKKSNLKKSWVEKELNRKVRFLVADFKRSSSAVSRSIKGSRIETKHDELHRLIRRGVVSAPLIIEMHREISEFYENLHAQELRAIESLWSLYALRGTIAEESIE